VGVDEFVYVGLGGFAWLCMRGAWHVRARARVFMCVIEIHRNIEVDEGARAGLCDCCLQFVV
jgi:hypothetical protein